MYITDNNCVNDALVYAAAAIFFICVFPLHVTNYAFISTYNGFAGASVMLYRIIPIIKVNTRKKQNEPKSGEDGKKKQKLITAGNWLRVFNNLCLTKVVQLGDYGVASEINAYAALVQSAVTNAVYAFIEFNGGKTKLRNYVILNYEHDYINYYAKVAGVINVITLLKIFAVIFLERINEGKAKKTVGRPL